MTSRYYGLTTNPHFQKIVYSISDELMNDPSLEDDLDELFARVMEDQNVSYEEVKEAYQYYQDLMTLAE